MDELGVIEEGVDWRNRLAQDIRDGMIHDIWFNLQKKLPTTASTTLVDLKKVAPRIEERIYAIAFDFGDYLRRFSLRKDDLEYSRPIVQLNNFLGVHQLYQLIPAEGNVQGNPSSSISDQVSPDNHKDPSHPCEVDRISDLPNDLIRHIISSLSMQEAVCTSVLSHRWVDQWAFVRFIDVDIDWFDKDREQFSSFVDNLLLRRDHVNLPMDTFQLHSFAIDRASSWIDHAIKHNAQVIRFAEYKRWEPFYLDPELVVFSSQHLKTLELNNAVLGTIVSDQLNNSCPALQNLLLVHCLIETQAISSSSLKNLGIIDCSLLKDLSIWTPSLVSLHIEDRGHGDSLLRTSYQITSAVTLIDASNVTTMDLTAYVKQVTFVDQAWGHPLFQNLTNLCLGGWCLDNKYSLLRRYIQHSPKLKKVTLKPEMDEDWGYHRMLNLELVLHGINIVPGVEVEVKWY
ncbi:hypothetical protein GUJ93_ZPchr0008g13813 [Zizania palustris]|uniref:F-box domain-containing protein n=1 Tax=Zizania palustris TaxID=103762 RepID=A0A8J5V4C4_ZIZPA|nr:hypothetical protein GUJ93_ZPchr0008g13813 [Zizania palustris]